MNISPVNITVSNASGTRLDKYLSLYYPDYSRTFIQKLITNGGVTVNSVTAKPSRKIEDGDLVSVIIPETSRGNLSAENIPLKIIYEDNDILVTDKSPGLTTHPSPGQTKHTLINAILSHYPRTIP